MKNKAAIIKYDIPHPVTVRKHVVDTEGLKALLKHHKNTPIRQLADALQVKKTTVEHWFRGDVCFSIPDPDIWVNLKELLNIQTTEFDAQVMEFEVRPGVFEKAQRVYDPEGIAPTLTTQDGEKIILFLK